MKQNFIKLFTLLALGGSFISCEQEELVTGQEPSEVSAAKNQVISIRSVSANGDDGNVPANTIDGSLSTRWSSLGATGKYITYDLGSSKDVSAVKIAWFKGNQRKAYFKIRVGNSTSSLSTVFDAKTEGSSGTTSNFETFNFPKVNARYVRISCFGNSTNDWNSITETQILGEAGDINNPPTGDTPTAVLGITEDSWKINSFVGAPSSSARYYDDITDAPGIDYDTYEDPNFFYTDGEWTYFKCYRGLGGSANSNNPRVELRELNNGSLANWDGSRGNNTMTWTVRVDQLPRSTSGNDGVLCFGQIHGPGSTVDDVIRLQFLGSPDQSSGSVRLKISGYITEKVLGGSKILDLGYKLDTEYTFRIEYNSGTVKVFDSRYSSAIFSQKMDTSTEGNYFKVGNYLQSVKNASFTGSNGVVAIKNLVITH